MDLAGNNCSFESQVNLIGSPVDRMSGRRTVFLLEICKHQEQGDLFQFQSYLYLKEAKARNGLRKPLICELC